MEDEQNNVKKTITIIAITILFVLIAIIIFSLYMKNEDDRIEKTLKKNGYERVTDKIYQKNKKSEDSEATYIYNIVNKEYEKTILLANDSKEEGIDMIKKDNKITALYTYRDLSCTIIQTASYEDGKLIKCDISRKTPSCKAKCDKILKEIKKFDKEKLQ